MEVTDCEFYRDKTTLIGTTVKGECCCKHWGGSSSTPLHNGIRCTDNPNCYFKQIMYLSEYKRKSVTCQECYDEGIDVGRKIWHPIYGEINE